MSDQLDDPFGLGASRQRRLSEDETRERMLKTGEAMVGDVGLRVSFDLLRLEDVIAEADVSRSAAYKLWPRKELYYAELLLRLAGAMHPAQGAFDHGTPLTAVHVALDHVDWLRTVEGRRRLLVEMCRLGALQNFEALRERLDWRIYMTLHAALVSMPPTDYRQSLADALTASERQFIEAMVVFYETMISLIGYQLKDHSGEIDLPVFAALGAAVVEGLVLTSGATPELAERRFMIDPFNVGTAQDWSYPGIGFTSIVLALAEPKDTTSWGDQQIAEKRTDLAEVLKILEAEEGA